jgi:hypothetical protein
MLAGCVQGRPPRPVAIQQPADDQLTCKQIDLEYRDNTMAAEQKIEKNRSSDIEEIFAALLIWPGLVDSQNADGVEANHLLERNLRLREIAQEKNCAGVTQWPPQPERYS